MSDLFYLNVKLKNAAALGQIEMCNFFINAGAEEIEEAFYLSCKNGLMDSARNLIDQYNIVAERNRKISIINYNLGLKGACESGNLELVNFMIERGANDFNTALSVAAENNNLDITKIAVENILKYEMTGNFLYCFNLACKNNSFEVIRYFCENRLINSFNFGFYLACKNGNEELIRYLFEKGATNTNEGLYTVCAEGNPKMVELLISLGANDFAGAIKYAKTEEIRKMLG